MIKKFFYLSEIDQVKPAKKLTENLKTLLRQLKDNKIVIRSSAEQIFLFLSHKKGSTSYF